MRVIQLAVISSTFVLLAHNSVAQTPPQLTTLYSFTGQNGDGGSPQCTLTKGPGGVLYGTTYYGGTASLGTVFELTPPAAAGGAWTETVLYSFTGQNGDGSFPRNGVAVASSGVLYGTTDNGGAGPCPLGCGTAFSLTPPASPGGAWTESVLHKFGTKKGDGFLYPSNLVIGPGGVLYGATHGQSGPPPNKGGVVFRLKPPAAPGGQWTEAVLHTFNGQNGEGSFPNGVIVINGSLYGTSQAGGAFNGGTVFELTPPSSAGQPWAEAILYSFPNQSPAVYHPTGALVAAANGALYGTAFFGAYSPPPCYNQCGAIFELSPPSAPGGTWTETILYDFTGPDNNDGRQPVGVLLRNGVLYGTTTYGGPSDNGTVFALAPPSGSGGAWSETVLYSFTGPTDGATPFGGLVAGANGALYGTNSQAALGFGTVFQLTP